MLVGGGFLTSVLNLWISLLEALGAKGTHWEWRKRAWQQSLETRLARLENVERAVRTTTRMCRSCRYLMEGSLSVCPSCGASMREVPRGGWMRALGLLVPMAPSVSLVLITGNVVISLVAFLKWGGGMEGGLMRLLSPPGEALYLLGAKWGPAIQAGQIWRLVTANYLHGGLVHLAFNCYALMSLGPLIEESFGARKMFVLYTVSGVAGFALSAWWHPQSLSIGASAAIYGLLAFAVVYGKFRAGPSGRALADQLMRWLLFGLVMFLFPGFDNTAHVGGVIAGALLGLCLDPLPIRTRTEDLLWSVLGGLALLATIGSFAAMALSYSENLRQISG